MRGRKLRCWGWAAIAIAVAVLAVACSGDADQQTQPEAAAPPAAANAPSSASATEEAAQQPAQSEPIQWSEGRCLSRLQDTSTYADSLQVDVTDLQLDVRRGVTAEARWRWETSIQPTLDEMALAERELEEHCSEQLAPLDDFLEVSQGWRQGIEAELASISASRGELGGEATGWTDDQCWRRYQDVVIYWGLFDDPLGPLGDLEKAARRGDVDLAMRIGATRVEPAIEEFRAALSDVTEHCELSEAVPAEAVADVEWVVGLAPGFLADIEERYADLID